jgi:DNA-binding NtrC family response regulator
LAVVEVHLPPLHARREDIPLLASNIIKRISGPDGSLPEHFVSSLVERSWPGNVRELRNYIERHVSLGFPSTGRTSTGSLPAQKSTGATSLESMVPLHLPLKDARSAWMETFELVYVRSILQKTRGNVTRAAELAGVSRRFLQRTVARLGISASEVGADPKGWNEDEEDDGSGGD